MELGVINGTVRLAEHDEEWAEEAVRMIAHLKEILKGEDILGFEHVGSTAIKSIPAKPIIDIAVAIRDYSSVERYRGALEAEGFQYLGEVDMDDWMYYIGHPGQNDRTHHIHMVTAGSKGWLLYLAFRDYLNACPEAAKRYGDLKRSLCATLAKERKKYRDSKADLIQQLDLEALAWWEEKERKGK